jgi:predicted DNA-binding transcriptional regulator AlpA
MLPLISKPAVAGGKAASVRRFMNEVELAAMIGVGIRTLQRWRLEDRGPKFRKLGGAVRYDSCDVDSWILSCPAGGGK